jgi:hypothetical protein
MARDGSWTSPSDLADYAYCPRSHWYRHHPPAAGPSATSGVRSRAGARYHARVLSAERRHAEHRGAYWVGILVGVALFAAGFVWLFRP